MYVCLLHACLSQNCGSTTGAPLCNTLAIADVVFITARYICLGPKLPQHFATAKSLCKYSEQSQHMHMWLPSELNACSRIVQAVHCAMTGGVGRAGEAGGGREGAGAGAAAGPGGQPAGVPGGPAPRGGHHGPAGSPGPGAAATPPASHLGNLPKQQLLNASVVACNVA